MRRFDPGYARAKQKIEAGELGRIELFRALSRDTYPPSLKFLLGSGGIFLDTILICPVKVSGARARRAAKPVAIDCLFRLGKVSEKQCI
jgi:predicted dehydrogenase